MARGAWERPVVEGEIKVTGEQAHKLLVAYAGDEKPGGEYKFTTTHQVPIYDVVLRGLRMSMPQYVMDEDMLTMDVDWSADDVEYRDVRTWALAPQSLLRLLEGWAALGDEPMPISVVVRRVREAIGTASAQGSVLSTDTGWAARHPGHWEDAPGCELVHAYGEEGWIPMSDGHQHWVPDGQEGLWC